MEASWAVLEASWGPLGPSWDVLVASWSDLEASRTLLGRLGGHLGPSWANFQAILAVLEAILEPSGAGKTFATTSCAPFRVAGGTGRSPRGNSFRKEPKPKSEGSSTPGTPVMNQQGAADRRRLRRITAAPCLFGRASQGKREAVVEQSYGTARSPNGFRDVWGNAQSIVVGVGAS